MSDGRYAYETKRPLQLCWLATIGTQEGRIAHHLCITATMPPFFASEAAEPSATHRGSTWFHLSRCRSAMPLRLSKKDRKIF